MSFQATRAKSKTEWKARVRAASLAALPEGHWATGDRIAVTLFYFPAARMQGDLDNIVKLVLDALVRHIYLDDSQVERILVQKFEPTSIFPFSAASPTLEAAVSREKPVLYVRVSSDPFEELS